ncbi:MAG: phenylalanine--tRNA ligase subunit beta [Gammaproteobacteria bacterium]|nr:phenylalanine--tRNA ligase subunit beta [Gammaproteobacteria bacterium]
MKITQHWLEEFTPVGGTAAELGAQLTLAGLEVESITPAAPPCSGVVVGEVLSCARHPQAERLSVCEVTTDGADRLQIVCGAPNVRAGLRVAVARIGARLPGDITIGRARLRGLESQGMLCSARELGLGAEHDGILELPAQFALGLDLRVALDLDDMVLEVNATPNRGDCMSVFGIARDHAAARRHEALRYAAPSVAAAHAEGFAVEIAAPRGCPLFAGRLFRGLRNGGASPLWLRERLRRIGINSISPVVDVTNYVMAELGQPMHAYDRARLAGRIVVRPAASGERLVLLDDKEYELDPEFLVIADDEGPVGLAGIMGGRRTAIDDRTVDVYLEVAHFTPQAVAGRARRLGLFTDAAQRFERGVDPGLPQRAIERASALLVEICGGAPGPVELHRVGTHSVSASRVKLRRTRLRRALGTTVPDEAVRELLGAIGDGLEETADGWSVAAPAHRFDLAIEADLVEEVARLRGFDSIPESPAQSPQQPGLATESEVAPERLVTAMIDRGYHEAITYSFVDPAWQAQLFPDTQSLTLANPISADMSAMRVSLWPGLLRACRENLRRQQSRVRLFELGRKFVIGAEGLQEIDTLSGIATGTRWPEQWGAPRDGVDFYDVKADVEALFALTVGVGHGVRFVAAQLPCLHPGRTAQVWRGDQPIGWLGELHPRLARAFDISPAPLLFDIDVALGFTSKPILYKKISKFPSVRRDLAIVVDENVSLADLRENVTVSAAGVLSDLLVFDVYRGPGVESGRKSVALGLILQDSSRTLTDVDADAVTTAVVARLRDVFSATIRD